MVAHTESVTTHSPSRTSKFRRKVVAVGLDPEVVSNEKSVRDRMGEFVSKSYTSILRTGSSRY